MDEVRLTWQDTKGPHGDGDLIARSVYDLPDPSVRRRGTKIVIVISRESRESDDSQVYCRLKLKEATGPGYRSQTFPTVQAAKHAAEELMVELTRKAQEPPV